MLVSQLSVSKLWSSHWHKSGIQSSSVTFCQTIPTLCIFIYRMFCVTRKSHSICVNRHIYPLLFWYLHHWLYYHPEVVSHFLSNNPYFVHFNIRHACSVSLENVTQSMWTGCKHIAHLPIAVLVFTSSILLWLYTRITLCVGLYIRFYGHPIVLGLEGGPDVLKLEEGRPDIPNLEVGCPDVT